ncbi:MAG: SH3 domain-containing protein [Chloroflexota bacterium]
MTQNLLWIPFSLLMSVAVVSAQMAQCAPLILESFEEIGDYCAQLGRNQVCYGHDLVDAEFNIDTPPEFDTPSDRADVIDLSVLNLQALDLESEEWGIALFNVQADLPETIPGQNVSILAIGNMRVENAVSEEEAHTLDSEIRIEAIVNSNLRDEPDAGSAVMDGVVAGTELVAYGIDDTGNWLRVQREPTPLWISREVIETDGDLSSLPVLTGNNYSAMQAFRLSSGIGRVNCESITEGVIIQTSENTETRLNINGSDIEVGSTVMLTIDDALMRLYVLDGQATVNETDGIPAGYAVQTDLDENGDVGIWYGFQEMDDATISQLEIYMNVPASLLHYPITMPTPVDLTTPWDETTSSDEPNSDIRPDDDTGTTNNVPAEGNDDDSDEDDSDEDADSDDSHDD